MVDFLVIIYPVRGIENSDQNAEDKDEGICSVSVRLFEVQLYIWKEDES
jgi:hypothetical protein